MVVANLFLLVCDSVRFFLLDEVLNLLVATVPHVDNALSGSPLRNGFISQTSVRHKLEVGFLVSTDGEGAVVNTSLDVGKDLSMFGDNSADSLGNHEGNVPGQEASLGGTLEVDLGVVSFVVGGDFLVDDVDHVLDVGVSLSFSEHLGGRVNADDVEPGVCEALWVEIIGCEGSSGTDHSACVSILQETAVIFIPEVGAALVDSISTKPMDDNQSPDRGSRWGDVDVLTILSPGGSVKSLCG